MPSCDPGDFLPCLLELRRAVLAGADLLKEKSDRFKVIWAMEKVQAASNPRATALALFLQDLEHECISEIATLATTMGARVMSYVLDGLYVLARDEEHLRHVYREVASTIFNRRGLKLALKDAGGELMEEMQFVANRKRTSAIGMGVSPRRPKSQRTQQHGESSM